MVLGFEVCGRGRVCGGIVRKPDLSGGVFDNESDSRGEPPILDSRPSDFVIAPDIGIHHVAGEAVFSSCWFGRYDGQGMGMYSPARADRFRRFFVRMFTYSLDFMV